MDKSGDCWIWTGTVSTHGRCIFNLDGRVEFAQRVSYAHHARIPPDMQVDLRCGNKRCVRFSHLSLGPLKHRPKRKRDPVPDVVKLRMVEMREQGSRNREIARETGFSESTVSRCLSKIEKARKK